MTSAEMFSFAMSGSLNENQMNSYKEYAQNISSGISGWLLERANRVSESFNNFYNSRAWELSKRLTNKDDGEFVAPYDIGYLGTTNGINNAQGLMRSYIMANPVLMQHKLDTEDFDPWEGQYSDHCNGVGADNLFYRNAMNGLLNLNKSTEGDVTTNSLNCTRYSDSLNPELSFRERVNINRTWKAAEHHLANQNLFNIKSE